MEWLTFFSSIVSSIVSSIAWPVSIIFLVYLLREPISRLINLLKKIQYKDIEFEFGEDVHELKTRFAKSLSSTFGDQTPFDKDPWRKLAVTSPGVCISQAYRELEDAGVSAVQRRHPDLSIKDLRKWSRVLDVLLEDRAIDEEKFYILRELRMLRNQAKRSEDSELTIDDAIGYAEAALSAASYLQKGQGAHLKS